MLPHEFLHRTAAQHPLAPAVDDGTTRWTFAELEARVAAVAAGLHARGVGAGDRVAVLSRNRADFAALYFAVPRLGATLVPLNWRLGREELAVLFADAEPRCTIVEASLVGALPEGSEARFVWGDSAHGARTFEELIVPGGEVPHAAPSEDDACVQMYTSGTSGRPKGALLTHRNCASMTSAWLLELDLHPGDRFLQLTPLFHVGGMLMVLSTVAAGAWMRMLPEFDPVEAIETLENDRITHTLMVPSMLQWTLRDPHARGRRFPDLRLLIYGASPMPPDTMRRALDSLDCDYLQGYGLTETTGVALVLRPADHRPPDGHPDPTRLAAAGRPPNCCEVRVVDRDGRDVEGDAVGEIVTRGDNVSPGYWRNPDATEQAWRDGWFRTGDLARVDAEGYVTVVDRAKDMILVGGENVYPREIEDVLAEHSDVREAAVIGIPHDVWGEEVLALVVLEDGAEPDPRGWIRHCRARLARFKCPTRAEPIDALPRSAAGKVQKRLLRAPYWRDRGKMV